MTEQMFVARERELSQLQTFLDRALAGQGQVCFVTGEAGTGKTALVTEFARRAQNAHADLLAAIGVCNAQTGIGDPYLPFREVLSLLTGDVEAGGVTEENAGRLTHFLRVSGKALVELGPDLIDIFVPGGGLLTRAAAMAAGKVGWLDRLQRLTERKKTGDGDGLEQRHIFEQYTNVLQAMAAQQPLMVVLDDLQWADADSISLLFHLVRRLGESRILMVGTYRPDDVALGRRGECHPLEPVLNEFKRYFGGILVDLGRAEEAERRQFVDAVLDAEPNRFGEGFREALYSHTKGHPLFTVELLRDMRERGDLVQDEQGQWIEGLALDWGTLPARVEGVIEKRIGRLAAELREVLTVASVEGEDFTAEVIARVQALNERQLVRRLSGELDRQYRLVGAMGRQRLGRQRLSLYRFQHSLFQKYLYNGLDEIERAYLHEDVGNVLEELYGDQTEEIAVQLAWHFQEAEIEEKAIEYLLLAGDRARRQYANEEAIQHFQRALALIEDAPLDESHQEVVIQLHEGLGDVLALTGQHDEARVAYQDASTRVPEHDRIWRARLHRKTGKTWELQRRYGEASGAYDRAEAALGREPDESDLDWWQEWLQIQHDRMFIHYWTNQLREMAELAERARPIMEKQGTPSQRASFFQGLALLGFRQDRFVVSEETLAHPRAMLDAIQESGSLRKIANAQFTLGFGLLWYGDLDEAENALQSALAEAKRTGDVILQSRCLTYLAVLCRKRGQVEEARRLIPRSQAAAEAGQMVEYVGMAKANLAWLAWREGRHAEAETNGRAALELMQQVPQGKIFLWLALWPLIAVALAQVQAAEAVAEAVEHARALFGPAQQPLPNSLTVIVEGAIQAWEGGDTEGTRTKLDQALELAQEMGYL